jgi:hypothetical protein
MTRNEYNHIDAFYKKHYNLAMKGHIWLSPRAIREIPNPSDTATRWAREKRDIYLKPVKIRPEDEYFYISCVYNGLIKIHRKYVKSTMLFHYNY